jgi:hypothetical protein
MTVVIIEGYQPHFIQYSYRNINSIGRQNYGDYQCGFEHNRPLIRYSAFVRYWRKNGSILGQYISYSQISRRPMTQVRNIVQYSPWILYTSETNWAN